MAYYNELEHERHKTIKAAQDLGYGPKVVGMLRNAKSSYEMSSIMTKARKAGNDADKDR